MPALPEVAVAVRRATAADARFIQQLSVVAFAEYDPHAGRTTANMMLETHAQTLVAERDGKALGFIVLHRPSPGALSCKRHRRHA